MRNTEEFRVYDIVVFTEATSDAAIKDVSEALMTTYGIGDIHDAN